MKQLGVWALVGIWAFLCLGAALFASWQGYGGRPFAATLGTFAFLLLVMLLFAARGVTDGVYAKFGSAGGVILCAFVFLAAIFYFLGTSTFTWSRVVAVACLVFVPLGLAVGARNAAPGAWQDFLSIAAIWVFVKFAPRPWLWPYPGAKLSHILTVLVALSTAVASFLLVRRAKGVGYSMGWGKRWEIYVGGSFLLFALIAIPLGSALRFITFAPQWSHGSTYLGLSLGILLFTAWPEELLFRGLVQNFLAKASKSDLAGWWTASVLFGLSHMTNMARYPYPNWRYVILASIAGLFYGWTWRKTGSLFASALVHAAVDSVWHFFFHTL